MTTIQRDLMILLQPPTYILLELCIILISLIIYKPSTLIISPWTFSTQLGASILLFCLFQYAILFCTLLLSTAWQEAQDLPIMQGKISGVELKGQRVGTQCLGKAPFHYFSLAMFGNSEVFFVSLSLLSHCFVIIIKYSRAQKGTQVSYPHYHSFLLLQSLTAIWSN